MASMRQLATHVLVLATTALAAYQPSPAAARSPQHATAPRSSLRLCAPAAVASDPKTAAWTDLTEDAKRLTDAQIARTVAMVSGASGVLCTSLPAEVVPEGGAFPAPAPFVIDAEGCPLMPLASSEAATNLQHSKLATFYARAPQGGASASSVLTLIGEVSEVAEADVEDQQLRDLSGITGVPAEQLATRKFVRLTPSRVHLYDAVRGAEAWVPTAEYGEADANPLADASVRLLSKMNTQRAAPLRLFAATFAGVPMDDLASAELLAIDQMGFDMRLQLGPSAPASHVRAGFKMPPANEEECISLFMKLFQEAYEKANPVE